MTRFRGFPVARLIQPTRKRKQQKAEYQDAMTANDTREYIVTTDEAVPTPPANQVSHYRTADGWREKDDTGTASDVGGGGGGDSGILVAAGTIAHAAILTLPTAAVEIVAAPGVNQFIEFLGATLVASLTAAYTGIDAGTGYFLYDPDDTANQASTSAVDETANPHPLTTTGGTLTRFTPFVSGGATPYADAIALAGFTNKKLAFVWENAGVDFTGGNAANALYYSVSYRVVSTDPADYA